jgi:hypothetical protein
MKNFLKILSTTSLLVGASFLVNLSQAQASSYDDLPSVEVHLENLDKLKEEISFETETPIVFTKTDKHSKKEKKRSSKNKGNKKEKKQSSKEKVAHEFIEEDITPEPASRNTAIDSMKSMPNGKPKPVDLIPAKKGKGKKVKTEEATEKLPEIQSHAKPNLPATSPAIINEPAPTAVPVAPQPAPVIIPEPQKPAMQQPVPLPNNAAAPSIPQPQPPIPSNMPAPVAPTPAPTNVAPLPTPPVPSSNVPPVNAQPVEAPKQKTSFFNKLPFIGKKEEKVATAETQPAAPQPVAPPMVATPPMPVAANNPAPIPANTNAQNLAPLPPKNIHTNKPMGENDFISPSNLDKLPSQLPTPSALPPIPDEKGNIPPQTKLDAPAMPSFGATTPLDPSKAPSGDTLVLSIKYPNNGVALSAQEQGNLLTTAKTALTGSKDTKIKIVSYSDTQREDNSSRRVALQRVITARKFLIDHGLDSSRMNVQVIGSSTVTSKNKLDVIVAK